MIAVRGFFVRFMIKTLHIIVLSQIPDRPSIISRCH